MSNNKKNHGHKKKKNETDLYDENNNNNVELDDIGSRGRSMSVNELPTNSAYNKMDYRNTIGTSDLRRIRDQTLRERGGKPKKNIKSLDFNMVHAKGANFPGALIKQGDATHQTVSIVERIRQYLDGLGTAQDVAALQGGIDRVCWYDAPGVSGVVDHLNNDQLLYVLSGLQPDQPDSTAKL
ncbi:hypothetical protein PPL_05102 [Heterostelium album PN500]|uniref:Uncharacterized protein n=1 Tax=Heterostelium pallidum (strain ATCC 26659 / Pp 5 / PN500) TaxID=670386 RepID=D3B9F8_HETP5|nr:hypothetical protein PPL_05102 [Heterostelium album PN500]EFA81870.1 hypothetical protein PPL_05102 [Heterostelium album PN500]|eukprot:XP_020433987.1 hypothetical protein PPL_05102 [Heterostelium album PN500]